MDREVIISKIADVLTAQEYEELLEIFDSDVVDLFVEFFKRYPKESERIFAPEYIATGIIGG